jgi:reverse gyrase
MPTGSGKTWIQGILAKYYCLAGKTVTIIEPNDFLQHQTSERLGPVDFNISFMTMDFYFKHGCQDDIIIIDEYDCTLLEKPYSIFNQ